MKAKYKKGQKVEVINNPYGSDLKTGEKVIVARHEPKTKVNPSYYWVYRQCETGRKEFAVMTKNIKAISKDREQKLTQVEENVERLKIAIKILTDDNVVLKNKIFELENDNTEITILKGRILILDKAKILGDRMLVKLEHDKTVLNANYKKLQKREKDLLEESERKEDVYLGSIKEWREAFDDKTKECQLFINTLKTFNKLTNDR